VEYLFWWCVVSMSRKTFLPQLVVALNLLCLATATACGALTPASVFTNNMVLQRDQPIPVWGSADPGSEVTVELGSVQTKGMADSTGRWNIALEPCSASAKPRRLTIRSGDSQVTLNNVVVGDVWLCSGQSNMQWPLGDSEGGQQFADEHGNNPLLRLLMVPKKFEAEPSDTQSGKWIEATPKAAREFSAVGFSFGAALTDAPEMHDVPIGLIDSSFGGTAVEGWIPADDLESFPANRISRSMFGESSQFYNAMIQPLVPMAIRGVVWYQGESNSDQPAVYSDLLKTMIRTWRRDFRQHGLPFIIIQLPAYNRPFQAHSFTWIREQQAKVADSTDGVALVVTYDTHDGSDLHPREKLPIGKRAAEVARVAVYGKSLVATGPAFESSQIDDGEVRIRFDTHGEKLVTTDGSQIVTGFQLAGSDGEYRFAAGRIDADDSVVVSADEVPAPETIRFAWGAVPITNLVSSSGWPVVPFRTDSFGPVDVEYVEVPIHRAVKTLAYELELDAIGSLRSLGVGGEQFISNELGMQGGSCIPTFWGPQNLNQVEALSPDRLRFHDAEVFLTYTFASDAIAITIENKSGAELKFQIALAPGVRISKGQPAQVERGDASIQAIGFDSPSGQGGSRKMLVTTVPSNAAKSMRLVIPERSGVTR
jgi:sialate O-acetylesterase